MTKREMLQFIAGQTNMRLVTLQSSQLTQLSLT